jgi:hypothetical protein
MEKLPEMMNGHVNGCGGCISKGCDTCESAKPAPEDHMLFTRRNFGRTLLAASAGALITSCAKPDKEAGEAAGKADSLASGLSPELAVVQKSKDLS